MGFPGSPACSADNIPVWTSSAHHQFSERDRETQRETQRVKPGRTLFCCSPPLLRLQRPTCYPRRLVLVCTVARMPVAPPLVSRFTSKTTHESDRNYVVYFDGRNIMCKDTLRYVSDETDIDSGWRPGIESRRVPKTKEKNSPLCTYVFDMFSLRRS